MGGRRRGRRSRRKRSSPRRKIPGGDELKGGGL